MARSYVLTKTLGQMKLFGSVTKDRDGFRVLRPLRYHGNPDAIDADGTKAAEHMAVADALRIAERMLARGKPDNRSGPTVCATRKEYEALTLVVKALRAKGSTGG